MNSGLANKFENMIVYKEALIFALNSVQPAESKRLVQFLRYKSLNPAMMICAEGVYRNCMEDVYIVPWAWFPVLNDMIVAHTQYSVLHIHKDYRTIEYILSSGDLNQLGFLSRCGAGRAQQQTAYTKVGESFYVTE